MNALESGNVAMNNQVFDPASILQAISEDYAMRATAKDISLLYECSVSSLVNADEALLYQVFDNLISNALKYSPWKRRIWVKGAVQTVEGFGDCFVASFQDEGEGISEQDMKRLFGKFARLSAQPTGNESSTGLGLSIVKKLVETMHGRVWCESEYGKGAAFFVALPIYNADEL
jgi:signal transduction histidine kinase